MKISHWPSLGLVALLTAGFCPMANAGLFSDNFEMLVVAETAKDAPQAQTGPIAYSAIDGGYIEAGDPIVGDTPPTADRVRQALFDALKEQGFEANRTAPAVLLTYYWGVLRIDHQEIRLPYGIKSNLNARIRLVSTERLGSGGRESHPWPPEGYRDQHGRVLCRRSWSGRPRAWSRMPTARGSSSSSRPSTTRV